MLLHTLLTLAHGVKLHAEKYELFKAEVRYVRCLVSAAGVRADPKDLKAVLALKAKLPQMTSGVSLGFSATSACVYRTS